MHLVAFCLGKLELWLSESSTVICKRQSVTFCTHCEHCDSGNVQTFGNGLGKAGLL